MKWLSIISVGLYMMTFVFVVYAVASSSRPDKLRKRALEFGGYFVAVVLLTVGNVPSAMITFHPRLELTPTVAMLAILRTLIVAFMFIRLGVILLAGYGQRQALKKYIAELEAERGGPDA